MIGETANLVRYAAASDLNNRLPNLGKSLTHHQVVRTRHKRDAPNTPNLDVGKVVLSATGGNPSKVARSMGGRLYNKTMRISPHDARQAASAGVRKINSTANSLSNL